MYYTNYFFVFSILGNFLETFFYPDGNSGILYGPFTPVYGIGVCLIILFVHFLKKRNVSPKFIYIFLFGLIGLSLLELLGGVLIEKVFHVVFWDYSHLKFSIGHYIALEVGLIWGLAALLVAYIIVPFCDKWITKIPKIVTWILMIVFIIDSLATLFTKVLF